ncbi:hypothetical protein DZA65_02758 [Dickeya dianthicola]|uniref:Uncharacterized protein n=1 Tax=Dickeya dianthicola TaxID=204039 RepID=A0AAP6S0C0_9GAMM|nr:hypothetical protein [Dickeya dianthicola]ATO33774.1 hypothetical protein DDI_2606 [Dickeya dianthicola RNS04.9]AYC19641.1 hypothetical protein DZA65_02758 [Dickeya dianthicola]MBI0439989.1 hypothetical protein [Dickeya dianthicola]MBI0450815.1 hypothetical protein [Dickeya dianthicola]MBI0452117.1 hypothetical protein [Dickeya dianthicola]
MLKNYFYDQHDVARSDEEKREIIISAVLEIIKEGASESGVQVALDAIHSRINQTADVIQRALEDE